MTDGRLRRFWLTYAKTIVAAVGISLMLAPIIWADSLEWLAGMWGALTIIAVYWAPDNPFKAD